MQNVLVNKSKFVMISEKTAKKFRELRTTDSLTR